MCQFTVQQNKQSTIPCDNKQLRQNVERENLRHRESLCDFSALTCEAPTDCNYGE